SRQVVGVLPVDAHEVGAYRVRERRLREELRPGNAAIPRDEAVFAEMLLVKEDTRAEIQLLERAAVLEFAVAFDLNPELLAQALGRVAVRIRRGDAHRAAVSDEAAPLVGELVALGMAPEVVVIVEHENLLPRAERASPEMGGRETGDTAADDDEVV